MKPLYARLTVMELLGRKPLTVSLYELTSLSGTACKAYILIKNAGRCVRRSEVQEMLQVDDWSMLGALSQLQRDHYIERRKNGWYRVLTFPYDGARRPKKPKDKEAPQVGAQRACEVVLKAEAAKKENL